MSNSPHFSALSGPLSYMAITRRCAEQIRQFMASARRHVGIDARYRREQAYGVYMGWRALVFDIADPAEFARDDARMEALLGESGRLLVIDEAGN